MSLVRMTEPIRSHALIKAAVVAVLVAGAHTGLVWWQWRHFNPYVPASLGIRATLALTAAIGPAFFFALRLGFAVVFVLNAAYLTTIFWLAGALRRKRRAGQIFAQRTP